MRRKKVITEMDFHLSPSHIPAPNDPPSAEPETSHNSKLGKIMHAASTPKLTIAKITVYQLRNVCEFPSTPSPIDREDEPLFALRVHDVSIACDVQAFTQPFIKPRYSQSRLEKLHTITRDNPELLFEEATVAARDWGKQSSFIGPDEEVYGSYLRYCAYIGVTPQVASRWNDRRGYQHPKWKAGDTQPPKRKKKEQDIGSCSRPAVAPDPFMLGERTPCWHDKTTNRLRCDFRAKLPTLGFGGQVGESYSFTYKQATPEELKQLDERFNRRAELAECRKGIHKRWNISVRQKRNWCPECKEYRTLEHTENAHTPERECVAPVVLLHSKQAFQLVGKVSEVSFSDPTALAPSAILEAKGGFSDPCKETQSFVQATSPSKLAKKNGEVTSWVKHVHNTDTRRTLNQPYFLPRAVHEYNEVRKMFADLQAVAPRRSFPAHKTQKLGYTHSQTRFDNGLREKVKYDLRIDRLKWELEVMDWPWFIPRTAFDITANVLPWEKQRRLAQYSDEELRCVRVSQPAREVIIKELSRRAGDVHAAPHKDVPSINFNVRYVTSEWLEADGVLWCPAMSTATPLAYVKKQPCTHPNMRVTTFNTGDVIECCPDCTKFDKQRKDILTVKNIAHTIKEWVVIYKPLEMEKAALKNDTYWSSTLYKAGLGFIEKSHNQDDCFTNESRAGIGERLEGTIHARSELGNGAKHVNTMGRVHFDNNDERFASEDKHDSSVRDRRADTINITDEQNIHRQVPKSFCICQKCGKIFYDRKSTKYCEDCGKSKK